MDATALLALLGPFSIAVALLVLGALSRRLGAQTHARPSYLGFFVAAALMLLSTGAQFFASVLQYPRTDHEALWIVLENGLPALAVTIGVVFAWRYWSWLLAERD